MKIFPIIVTAGLATHAILVPPEYGTKPMVEGLKCVGSDIGAAFSGDFSNWVLPDFIGGRHLRAGDVSACHNVGR